MSQIDALKRLERIEAQARRRSLEPHIRRLAREMSHDLGEEVDGDELLDHAERVAKRFSEVGEEQAVAELAMECGVSVEELWAGVREHRERDGL